MTTLPRLPAMTSRLAFSSTPATPATPSTTTRRYAVARRLPARRYAVAAGAVTAYLVLGACGATPTAPAGPTSPAATASATVATTNPKPTQKIAAEPALHGYRFPAGMVDGRAGGGQLFSPIEGVLAVPSTPGPHPVVVIVHGSYPGCIDAPKDTLLPAVSTTPWPEVCGTDRRANEDGLTTGPDYVHATASMAYIARELAARGVATVAIDVHTKEESWGGEADPVAVQNALVTLHLSLLTRMNAGETFGLPWAADLKGQLDLTRLGLVGHSSGAGYAVHANTRGTFPSLKAVVALQPAINTPLTWKQANLAPTLVLSGQCDEQVGGDGSLSVGKELAAKQPNAVVLTASVARASHIGLVAGGGSDTIGLVQPMTTGACASKIAPAVAQSAVAQVTADFLQTAMAGGTAYRIGVGSAAPVTLAALTPSATVTPAPVTTLPVTVDPKSIRFDSSTSVVAPAKPAAVVLGEGPHV